MQSRMTKRLLNDLEQMQKVYADQFNARMLNNDIKHWIIGFEGAKGTLYQREKFELQFKFSNEYVEVLDSYLALFSLKIANRITSSNINNQNIQVIFIGKTPELEHIYSVNQYYLMNGQLPQMYHLYVSQSNPCYQVLQKSKDYCQYYQMKPLNDAEFVKKAAIRGSKSFLWSYHDEKC